MSIREEAGAYITIGVCALVPLCAWYSMNSYGGESALRNPIFLSTNRIICVAWGVTYVADTLAAWFFAGTPAAPLLAIVSNILPIPAAVFTVWFQRWYPSKVAAGD